MKWQGYAEYKFSGIKWLGEIPAHWEAIPLKFATRQKLDAIKTGPFGSQLLASEMLEEEIKVYNQRNVIDRDLSYGDNYISSAKYQELHSFTVCPGDVLVTTRGTIGRCVIVPQSAEPGILHPCLMRIQADTRKLLAEFLILLIQDSTLVQTQLFEMSNATTIEVIYSGTMRQVVIPLPPLPEQRAIVAFLHRETAKIDALIASKQRLIELLHEKRAALISQAVTKGLDPCVPMKDSGIEWLGDIPVHWTERKFKHVISFITSGSRGWAQYYNDEGAIFLRIGNISNDSIYLDLENVQYVLPPSGTEGERTRVHKNDVLISITADMGSIGVITEDLGEAYVNQHIALTRPLQQEIDSRWLGYCLLSEVGRSQIGALSYGGTKEGLGLEDIRSLLILVPPLKEQRAIAAYLDCEIAKLEALIAKVQEVIDALNKYRTALISAAVTGKIDVREAVL